ncbi:MAG: oligosaccharide flippase family protein [Leucobacter sp.]
MPKSTTLIRNIGLIGIGRVSAQAVALLLLPVLTANLSPAEYGVVELLITYVALSAPLISLQLELGVFRFLIDERRKPEATKVTISTAALPMSIAVVLCVVLGAVVGFFFHQALVFYFTANLATMLLFNLMVQVARGMGRNALYAVANIVVAASTLFATILAMGFNVISVDLYLTVLAIANAISALVLFLALRFYKLCNLRSFSRTRLKELLKYSVPLIPNALSWWVINASGRTVAAIFLGGYYVGILAVASKFASIVTGLSAVFSLAWMEAASVSINDSDRRDFFTMVVNQALRSFAALTVFIIGASPLLLSILVDDMFAEAYYYVPILLVGALCHSMVSFYSGVLIAQNRTGKVANTSIVSAIIAVGISLIFVHWIGLYAIVLSTTVAFFFMVIYRQVLLQREMQIKYSTASLISVVVSFSVILVMYYFRFDPVTLLVLGTVIAIVLVIPAFITLYRVLIHRRATRS